MARSAGVFHSHEAENAAIFEAKFDIQRENAPHKWEIPLHMDWGFLCPTILREKPANHPDHFASEIAEALDQHAVCRGGSMVVEFEPRGEEMTRAI